MLRIRSTFVGLTILGLSVVALAQSPRPAGVQQAAALGQTQTGLFELAQNGPQTLVERLRAIRDNSGYTGGRSEANESSRRTTSRRSGLGDASVPAPITPAPGTAAPVTPAPLSENAVGTPVPTPSANLPSVLVRRGAAGAGPTPITGASEPAVTEPQSDTRDDTWGSASESYDSSRRTARRWGNTHTPTYEAPATTSTSNSSPSSASPRPSAAGGGELSIRAQSPTLRVEALGPQTMAVGKPASYRVRLSNLGSDAANRVSVTAQVPDFVEVVSAQSGVGQVREATDAAGRHSIVWSVDRVSASSQQELTLQLQATQNQPVELQLDWMYHPAPLAARIEVQQPQLAIVVEGPVEMNFGETKIFKVKLSNPGNGPAENVSVDLSATGVSSQPNRIGTLAAGESRTLELELTANEAGMMDILSRAQGDGGLQAQAAHQVRVRRAALALQVSAPELIYAGTTATYQIRVANRGDAVAEGVIMQVDLPSGAKNGIGVDKQPITLEQPRWRIGDVSPGTERIYSMQIDLTTGGQNQLVARIQGTDNSSASDLAITQVEAIADLKLIVNDPKGPVRIGQDAVYEIQVVNRGSEAAHDIQLLAQFSEGIEPTAATGQRAEIMPGQVVFDPIASVPAGGKMTVKITARATQTGNLRFRAELNCGTPETKLVAEESTRFYGDATSSLPSAAVGAAGEPTPARR